MNLEDIKNFPNLKKWKSLGELNEDTMGNNVYFWEREEDIKQNGLSRFDVDTRSEVSSPVEDTMQARTEVSQIVTALEGKINKLYGL